jgi:hypothetical protein
MLRHLPTLLTLALCATLLLHGPVAQFADYHAFADQARVAGIPHPGDVLSNLCFAAVALWGMVSLGQHLAGQYGWRLFIAGLMLTAIGYSYYHLAPDNARLLWDRLPIALSCAGLLAATRAMYVTPRNEARNTLLLASCAVISVLWWRWTDLQGVGDLRWYLVFQILPLLLIPTWQALHHAPAAERNLIAAAILLYAIAKMAELYDHPLQALLVVVSGHTLKHCLAALAAAVLVTLAKTRFST